MNAATT